jgi:hypothetical protein
MELMLGWLLMDDGAKTGQESSFPAFILISTYEDYNSGISFVLQEEEEQWISGEELCTEGSSDEDDTAIRSRRQTDGKARKHRRVTPGKDARHRQGHYKSNITSSTSDSSGQLDVSPPEVKLECLTLTSEESHRAHLQEGNMLVTDSDEQTEISWRPKRGSIKLPNLSPEGRVEVLTGTDVATH